MTGQVKSSNIIDLELVEQYKTTADHYLAKAAQLWNKSEIRKASEMLWGAIAQYLKALAACKGQAISTHRKFYPFVRQLAKERKNPYLRKEFVELGLLHNNFYDEEIPPEDFGTYYHRTKAYLRQINGLVRIAAKNARLKR